MKEEEKARGHAITTLSKDLKVSNQKLMDTKKELVKKTRDLARILDL